jgi:hypothetical protein
MGEDSVQCVRACAAGGPALRTIRERSFPHTLSSLAADSVALVMTLLTLYYAAKLLPGETLAAWRRSLVG